MRRRSLLLALLVAASADVAGAQMTMMTPTTAPATAPTGRAGPTPGEEEAVLRVLARGLDQTESYVKGLGLDEKPAETAAAAIADARLRATKLAARRGESPPVNVRAEAQSIGRDLKAKLVPALPAGARYRLPDLATRLEPAPKPATKAAPLLTPSTRPATAVLGQPFPPFRMNRLDGKLVTNETLMGKPAVIVFGSWTSPGFRDQVKRLADLGARYGGRVNWLVVYTREMFPTTDDPDAGPERNRDDKIALPAHANEAERRATAKRFAEAFQLRFDVAPDAMDDRLSNGADGFPGAGFVLDPQGKILLRLDWAEPFAIKRKLDEVLAAQRAATK